MTLLCPNRRLRRKIRLREERWGPAEICQNLSEPIVSHSSQGILNSMNSIITHIESNCTVLHSVLGVERNVNILVSKDGEIVQCGSGKGNWPFRVRVEKQRDVAVLFGVSLRVPYPNCYSDTEIDMTCRIVQNSGRPRISKYRVDRSIRLATFRNRRITACSLQMRYLGRHGRRVSVQTTRNRLHASQLKSRKAAQKPLLTAGVAIEFIDVRPVLPLSCGPLLTLRDFGKFQVDPTNLSSLDRIFRYDHDIGTP